MLILHTATYSGNVHQTATAINSQGWAEFVLSIEYSGGNTTVVFRMPSDMVYKIRSESRSYAAAPDHDFPKQKDYEKNMSPFERKLEAALTKPESPSQ